MSTFDEEDVLASQGPWSLVDQGVVSATRFLITLALAREAPQVEYGAYFLAFSTMIFLQQTLLAGAVYWPLAVLMPQRTPGARVAYRNASFQVQAILGAGLAVLVGVAAATLEALGASAPLIEALGAMALVGFVAQNQEWVRRALLASGRAKGALLNDGIQAFVQLGTMAMLLLPPDRPPVTAVTGLTCLGAGGFAATLLGALQLGGLFSEPREPLLDTLRENWAFGRWLTGSALLSFGSIEAFGYLLVWLHGTEAVAVLGACVSVVRLSNPAILGATHWMYPYYASLFQEEGRERGWRAALRAGGGMTTFGVAFTMGLGLGGDPLMEFLYAGRYTGHREILLILAVHVGLRGVTVPASAALAALHRNDLGFRAFLVGAGVTVLVGYPLVSKLAVRGVAVGYVLSGTAVAFSAWTALRRQAREERPDAVGYTPAGASGGSA